jgi:hypothetical protein
MDTGEQGWLLPLLKSDFANICKRWVDTGTPVGYNMTLRDDSPHFPLLEPYPETRSNRN